VKVLMDVCTPVQVAGALAGHEVHTAARMGWRELENGQLLDAAEASGFDLLIICDKNMRYQQNFGRRKLAILELWTNHRPTLERHYPLIAANAEAARAGEYRIVDAPAAV
jgi:hypothetical protein